MTRNPPKFQRHPPVLGDKFERGFVDKEIRNPVDSFFINHAKPADNVPMRSIPGFGWLTIFRKVPEWKQDLMDDAADAAIEVLEKAGMWERPFDDEDRQRKRAILARRLLMQGITQALLEMNPGNKVRAPFIGPPPPTEYYKKRLRKRPRTL